METTLIILKPDAVQRGLIGQLIARFERKGLRLLHLVIDVEQLSAGGATVSGLRPAFGRRSAGGVGRS